MTNRIFNVEPVNFDVLSHEEKPFANNLAKWLKVLNPKKVLDIGCGPGIYVDSCIAEGIDAIGFDPDPRVTKNPNCRQLSMFDIEEKSDCVICLEVVEHIHEDNNDDIVSSLVNMVEPKGRLILSAAQPGQGGEGHINCKAPLYWMEKFLAKSLLIDNYETVIMKKFIIENGQYFGWFMNNGIVFKKP